MKLLQKIFEFYINASIHVALAVCCLTYVTVQKLGVPTANSLFGFIFFSTILGYNLTKYKSRTMVSERNGDTAYTVGFLIISISSILGLFYTAFLMPRTVLIGAGVTAISTIGYAYPVLFLKTTLRKVPGIKIFLIALSWTITVTILPSLYYKKPINSTVLFETLKNALFVIAITIPFDIRDLSFDNKRLKTIPQVLGVKGAKIVAIVLLLVLILLEYILYGLPLHIDTIVVVCIGVLLIRFSGMKRFTKYYYSFWVESLPILWGVIIVLK